MIAELTDDHFCDQTRPGDAAWNRPRWKRSGRDAVLTTPAGVFRADMDMGFQLRWLKLQFTRNVLTNTVHPSAAARTVLFFFAQVVLVADLRQLVPVDLAILTATAMATQVDALAVAGRSWQLESPGLQPFVKNRQAVVIPEQNLEPIAIAIDKQEQVTGKRVLFKDLLGQPHQTIEAVVHPRGNGAEENTDFR